MKIQEPEGRDRPFCVCYTCDDNYAGQMGVSLYSLCENNKELPAMDLFLFSDGISEEHRARLVSIAESFGRHMEIIDVRPEIEKLRRFRISSNVANKSLTVYARILIPESIPERYVLALYIDADTIVTGSIRELAERKPGRPLSAVEDIIPAEYKELIGLKGRYFNGGVLLFETEQWRKGGCLERIMKFLGGDVRHYRYSDQDVVNLALQGQIEALPLKYNHFPFYGEIPYNTLRLYLGGSDGYYPEQEYMEAWRSPAIVHMVYSVLDRPWFRRNMNPYTALWLEYVRKAGWPDMTIRDRRVFGRLWWKQMFYRLFGAEAVIRLEAARNKKRYASKKS